MNESNQAHPHHPLLRNRDDHHARVTFEELFFDLVYVFAITQLSGYLLNHLTFAGLVETLILWFAVWLGWQYTCWVTNWFDPETTRIRVLLFAVMFAALIMAAALPNAFGDKGMIFALAYVAIQVGRTAFIVWELGSDHPLSANYRRILGWLMIAAVFWIAGGFASGGTRAGLWIIAVLCEYVSPMFGFALPKLGRSTTRDWTIEGGHLAERCGLFVIVVLGETLLATGATLGKAKTWDAATLSALSAAFLGTLAMWWLYYGTSSKDATQAIVQSDDPGRIGAFFHYFHAILAAGVLATAVGNDLVLAHPHDPVKLTYALVLSGGPIVYLLGSAIYKRVVYGVLPVSHVAGALALAALVPITLRTDLLVAGWLTTIAMLSIGLWEMLTARERQMQVIKPSLH